jgi:uncharacterized protein YjgD (DUF1641 family)
MAEPILLNLPERDPREALYRRLENAPKEHAEALLSLLEIVQGLHDKGLLEIGKGALGSSEKILDIVVQASKAPEVIQAIRNGLVLTKLFAALEPELLEGLAEVLPKAMAEARTERPFGPVRMLAKMVSQDSRRLLTIGIRVLEMLGKDLGPKDRAK